MSPAGTRGAERLLGYREDEILNQPADLIFAAEDRIAGVPEQEAKTALIEGRAADERWHQRKDGTRFWGSGVMMAMHNRRGDVVGLVKIFRDETDVRVAAEQRSSRAAASCGRPSRRKQAGAR